MNRREILAGLDVGQINTRAVIMRGQDILGYCTVPTGFNAVSAAQAALNEALDKVGISQSELAGIVATGSCRDMICNIPPLNATRLVLEYVADAKGALFLNNNSRTVIIIDGNVSKAIRYDQNGNVLDVANNDKCADGIGIFYTAITRDLGLSEQEMSKLALGATKNTPIAVQCAVSAESEVVALMCEGVDIAEAANAILKFIAERTAAMCASMSLEKEIVVAGGLAKSRAFVKHLSSLMKQDVSALDIPEYASAIGAVVTSYEG